MKDYLEISKNPEFFDSVKVILGGLDGRNYEDEERIRLIKDKYFYAGYSARWMLQFPIEDVKADVKTAMSQISDCQSCWLDFTSSCCRSINGD